MCVDALFFIICTKRNVNMCNEQLFCVHVMCLKYRSKVDFEWYSNGLIGLDDLFELGSYGIIICDGSVFI